MFSCEYLCTSSVSLHPLKAGISMIAKQYSIYFNICFFILISNLRLLISSVFFNTISDEQCVNCSSVHGKVYKVSLDVLFHLYRILLRNDSATSPRLNIPFLFKTTRKHPHPIPPPIYNCSIRQSIIPSGKDVRTVYHTGIFHNR